VASCLATDYAANRVLKVGGRSSPPQSTKRPHDQLAGFAAD
jgi:hypothetical protein